MPKGIPKKKEDVIEPKPFVLSFNIGGQVFKAQADNILIGIEQLIPSLPHFIKARGTLSVQNNKLFSATNVYPFQIRKMKVNKVLQQIIAKRLTIALHNIG